MERLNIATIVPNNYHVSWEYVRSLFSLTKHYNFLTAQSALVSVNRNSIYEYVKEIGGDLLFIDSDIIFTQADIDKMTEDLEKYDVVTGVYVSTEGQPALLKRVEGDYELTEMQEGVNKIDACGAGFLAISERIISKFTAPFEHIDENGVLHGEDISFCHRMAQAGIDIYCDSDIKLGHLKSTVVSVDYPNGQFIY